LIPKSNSQGNRKAKKKGKMEGGGERKRGKKGVRRRNVGGGIKRRIRKKQKEGSHNMAIEKVLVNIKGRGINKEKKTGGEVEDHITWQSKHFWLPSRGIERRRKRTKGGGGGIKKRKIK
jgi:hypothetical protein